jgi:2-polyprenyl-6-methoxyphenol hydroxylase-like FAD-dependent oxidoreductase
MFGHSKPQVLIAGAGPVGLFSALCLARHGVSVRIVDEEWRSATHSYALALHPRTLELLDEIGVAATILSRARRIHSIALFDGAECHARIDLGRLTTRYPFVAVLPQSALESVLIEALGQHKIEVQWDRRLAQIAQGPEAVLATVHTLEKVSTGYAWAHEETAIVNTQDLEVPFVIGADGHLSLVRQQLGIEFETAGPTASFAVVEFEAKGDEPDEMCIALNEDSSGVLWPMPENRMRLSVELDSGAPPSDSREKQRLLLEVGGRSYPFLELDRLQDLAHRRTPWFKGDLGRSHWRFGVRFERRLASSFGKGRIWLAGDAAHMTGPVGAQSMNLGFTEAEELSRIVAGVLKGAVAADALSAYGDRSRAEWRFLLGLNAAALRPTPGASPWAVKRAERLLPCIPASGHHFDALVAQLGLEREPASR